MTFDVHCVWFCSDSHPTICSGRLLKATPARVSRLVTATYDTSGMCGRGHCIAKKATHKLINIPRSRHIGNFVAARSFRHVYRAIKFCVIFVGNFSEGIENEIACKNISQNLDNKSNKKIIYNT